MSQAELARACGWASQSRVANYEKDVREPSLMDIDSLAKALKIDAFQLIGIDGYRTDSKKLMQGGRKPTHITHLPDEHVRSTIATPLDGSVDLPRSFPTEDLLTIPLFDIQASMGPGIVVPDHLDVIKQLVVSKQWILDQRLNHSGVPNLTIITGYGDSMSPTFRSGDPLLVDRGVSSMDSDGVYVFTVGDMLHIKRLQQVGVGMVRVISDNRALYDPWDARIEDVIVHARVLIGLNVNKME